MSTNNAINRDILTYVHVYVFSHRVHLCTKKSTVSGAALIMFSCGKRYNQTTSDMR